VTSIPCRVAALSITVVTAAAAAACQGHADKAGGDTSVLTLATIDQVNANGQAYGPQAFVDGLAAVSGGRLTVRVTEDYGQGAAEAESNLVKAIAAGDVDGGWPATRAFANAGIPGLAAVEAPMTLMSYTAQKELAAAPVASKLMAGLAGTGVVGLGLTVGPLRRPFAADGALLGPEDWRDARVRVFNSPTQTSAMRALGARPANLGFEWIDEVTAANLRAAEFDIAQYAHNHYAAAGNITANVVLWPKMYVLSLSAKRFEALTAQQQGWVRAAADRAVRASIDATYDEATVAKQLCAKGAKFRTANEVQLAGLREKLRPTLDTLTADPANAALLPDIQAIAARHPTPEPLDVPAACQQGISVVEALGNTPTEVSALPDGVYRDEITIADVAAKGYANDEGWSGTWTLRVRAGTYEVRCRPIANPDLDCGKSVYDGPLELGDLRGTGSTVYFVLRPDRLAAATGCQLPASRSKAGHCFIAPTFQMDWQLAGDQLVFSNYVSSWTNPQFIMEPWTKIG
jgi:TRAP-type C4-dicarboxylate transport system substrate-binding protein